MRVGLAGGDTTVEIDAMCPRCGIARRNLDRDLDARLVNQILRAVARDDAVGLLMTRLGAVIAQ